jgi:hypothetical protein
MPSYQDFRGTDLLEPGYQQDIGNILVRDELGGVSNGYDLEHSTGNSGYSFGGNQMDLGSGNHEHYFSMVKDILTNARDANGNAIVPNGADYADQIHDALVSKGDPNALSVDDKALVNAALGSDYGREQIDSAFPGAVQHTIDHVWDVVSALPPGAVRDDLTQSPEMQATLADYDNQLHIDPHGVLEQFLHGQPITFADGTQAQLTDGLTQQQLFDFIQHQHEFQERPQEFETRYLENLQPYLHGMTEREINEQVATDRALEQLHEPIVVQSLAAHDPWEETAAQQMQEAGRAELHGLTQLHTPVLDQLEQAFPAPGPPAPPAWQLPEISLPPAHDFWGITTAAPEGGPTSSTWMPDSPAIDSRAPVEAAVHEAPAPEPAPTFLGSLFGSGASSGSESSGGAFHQDPASSFHESPATFASEPAASQPSHESGGGHESGSHGGSDPGAGGIG